MLNPKPAYKKPKRPFPQSREVSKDTEMVLDGAIEHRLNRAISANSTSCRGFSQQEHGFQSSKQIGALPRPQWLQFLESWRGCTENQSNRLLCGGARLCGNTTGSANAAFLSRWVSILSMTTGSSIQAMTLTAPPHWEQVSMSILNTRFNR